MPLQDEPKTFSHERNARRVGLWCQAFQGRPKGAGFHKAVL